MKWNVVRKLAIIFLGTMIMTALVLGVVDSHLYRNYIIRDRQDVMLEQGKVIAGLLAKTSWTSQDLNAIVTLVANSRTVVEVYDDQLQLIAHAPGGTEPDLNQTNRSFLQSAMMKKDPTITNGATTNEGMDLVMVTVPIIRNDQTSGLVVMQWMGLERHLGALYRLLLTAGIVSVVVTSLVSLYLLRRVTKPLREMSYIIRRMAKGDFSQKIKVATQDEVGELASAFNHMVDELASVEQMRRDFVAHASHELRSPLTSIKGFVGAILDGTIPTEQHRLFLERIQRESIRLEKLVDDLLSLSKLDYERQSTSSDNPELEATSLSSVVNDVLETLQLQVQEKQLQVHLQVKEMMIRGKRERIEQILFNLLSNAIRFTNANGQIWIRASKEGEFGKVEIQDDGIGIPHDEIERVFERFYKVDKARSMNNGGTGLGLSITKEIVEMYGGEIGLDSEPGKGTTVWFQLPLHKDLRS
jgi:signal transduction histidine kinase